MVRSRRNGYTLAAENTCMQHIGEGLTGPQTELLGWSLCQEALRGSISPEWEVGSEAVTKGSMSPGREDSGHSGLPSQPKLERMMSKERTGTLKPRCHHPYP